MYVMPYRWIHGLAAVLEQESYTLVSEFSSKHQLFEVLH